MTRTVLVQCVCDCCGDVVYCRANYDQETNSYEDGLPDGWEYIESDYPIFNKYNGDHCPSCLNTFLVYIEICRKKWLQQIKVGGEGKKNFAANDIACGVR